MPNRKPRDLLVRFLADVNPFVRDTDKVQRAYEDVAREQDDLARNGDQAARKLSSSYQRAADKISRDIKTSGKETKTTLKDTGKEAGQEFVANLGESISSGDLSGVLSGTAGGLASTFGLAGPIGIAFAGLATVGATVFAGLSAAAKQAAQDAQTAFDELISGADRESRLRSRLESLFGSYQEGLIELGKLSDLTGVSIADIADGLAYGGTKATELEGYLGKVRDAGTRTTTGLSGGRAGQGLTKVLDDSANAANTLRGYLERASAATDGAAKAEARRADALRTSASYFAAAYGKGSSTYRSQVPAYATGRR